MTGRIDIHQFVALTATNHARLYGLAPRKGSLVVGADADLAIWNPDREVTVSASMLHDRVGYTPYEGRRVRGWPEVVLSRGRVVVEDNELHVAPGSGQFLHRGTPEPLMRHRDRTEPVASPSVTGSVADSVVVPSVAASGFRRALRSLIGLPRAGPFRPDDDEP